MSFSFSSRSFTQPQTSFQFSSASALQGTPATTPITHLSSSASQLINSGIIRQPIQINPGLFNPPFQIDPGFIINPGLFNPPNQTQPSQPTNTLPTNVPSQLLALLAAIPIATDGRVITSEYHNTLRAAILALAGQLGVGLITPTVVLTLIPNFLADGNHPNWGISNGAATKPAETGALGWLPLQLPDGARLQSMKVFGTRSASSDKFEVRIVRQPVAIDASSGVAAITPLMSVDLRTINSPFSASTNTFLVSGLGNTATAAATEDYKTIDNSTYKYLLFAEIANGDLNAQINAIQINYEPGLAG